MKKKNIKALALALSIGATSVTFTGCNSSSIETADIGAPFDFTLDELSDETLLDEILELDEEKYEDLVTDFLTLEQYLITASKLDNLNLSSKIDNDKVNCDTILTTIEINQMIADIECLDNNSSEYKKALEILRYNEAEINKWISKNGQRLVNQMGVIVAKTKLAESCNLDASEYEKFSIFDLVGGTFTTTKVKYSSDNSEFCYTISESTNKDENSAILSDLIEALDDNRNYEPPTADTYNKSSYRKLERMIVLIKKTICSKYQKENNQIIPIKTKNEVIKTYEKVKESFK